MEFTAKRKKILLLLLDTALICLFLFSQHILGFMMRTFPPCLFAEIGLQCPACGGTRCFSAFFSGNFALALTLNPYFFCLFLYGIVLLFVLHLAILIPRKGFTKALHYMTHYKLIIALAIGFLLFGVIRNFISPKFDLQSVVCTSVRAMRKMH